MTSPRILVSGDPHLRVPTLETGKKYLDLLLQTEAEVKPDLTVITGDLFHNHAVLRSEVINAWNHYLSRTDPARKRVLMVGNHDLAGPKATQHALVALDRWPNVTIADRPLVVEGVGFLPYHHYEEEFAKAVAQIPKEVATLFVHNTFLGAAYENGFYDPDAFHTSLVERFDRVIGGHVHKRQQVANIFYVGSPYSDSFADAGEHKGLYVFTDEDRRFFELPLPRHEIVQFLTPEDFLDGFELTPRWFDYHYRVRVVADKIKSAAILSDPRYLKLKDKYKLSVVFDRPATQTRAIPIPDNKGLDFILDAYVNTILTTDLDRTRILATAKDILKDSARA